MSLSVAVRTVLIDVGTVGTTYTITGLSFQPKAIKCFWAGHSSASDAISATLDSKQGVGFATGAADRRCAFTNQVDASDSTQCDSYVHNAAVIGILDGAGALAGLADVQSFDSGGVTFVIDQQFGAALRVTVLLLGGSDITNASTVEFQLPASTGNFDVTSLAFQGDFAFFAHAFTLTAPPAGRLHASLGIGAAKSSSEQAVLVMSSLDNQTASDTARYCLDALECIAGISASAALVRCSFVSWLSNGFRVNVLEVGSQIQVIGLVLKGGSYAIKSFVTQTDTVTPIAVTGAGFTPVGGFVASHLTSESTQDTIQAQAAMSMGAFESASARAAQLSTSKDNLPAGIDSVVAIEYDAVYIREDTGSAGANLVGLMDVQSMDADGVTFIMDDADPDQAFAWTVLFGNAAAGGSAAALLLMQQQH